MRKCIQRFIICIFDRRLEFDKVDNCHRTYDIQHLYDRIVERVERGEEIQIPCDKNQ
jgi:hypothetical protein